MSNDMSGAVYLDAVVGIQKMGTVRDQTFPMGSPAVQSIAIIATNVPFESQILKVRRLDNKLTGLDSILSKSGSDSD